MTFTNTIKVDVGHPWKTAQVYVKQGDKDSRKIRAELINGAASWTIPVGTVATFRAKKPDDTVVTQDATIGSPNIVEVVLDEQVCAVFGVVRGEIRLVNGGEILNTFLIAINVEAAAVTDGDIVSRDVLDEYQALVDQMLAVAGSPLVANAAADMTDKTRVYVYTGSEAGYVTGDWYFWDGAAWTAGGAYNSQGIGDAFIEETAQYIKQMALATESDSTPYLYRPTPNPSAILADEEIVGGTIAFNQLASLTASDWSKQTVTMTVSDQTIHLVPTSASSAVKYARLNLTTNHVYFYGGQISADGTNIFRIGIYDANSNASLEHTETTSATATAVQKIYKPTTSAFFALRFANGAPTTAYGDSKNTQLIDLTAMFGSTIADYLNTLESGTAGAGVAKLREWGFLSKEYFAYDAGSLKSVNTEGKRVYDKNNNLLATYPTTDTALNGIFKLDSNNNLYADGDVYEADGTVTRRFGSVDLGSLSWTKESAGQRFYASLPSAKLPATAGTAINGISMMYAVVSFEYLYNDNTRDMVVALSTGGTLSVRNLAYISGTAAAFQTAMSGVYLCYELATASQTTETATPYTATQIVGKGGTEEWIDNRAVPVPVGHRTVYSIGVPDVPANASNATLKATVSGGKTTLSWS